MARTSLDEHEPDPAEETSELDSSYELVDEGPEPEEMDDPDEDGVVACPACGTSIWERAEKCNLCGHWMSGEAWEYHTRGEGSLAWKIVTVLVIFAFTTFIILLAVA